EEDINKFLRTNSGLKSRFTQRIRFRSYTPDELVEIAEVLAPEAGTILTDQARDVLRQTFTELCGETDSVTAEPRIDVLGNARFVRQVINKCSTARNRRLVLASVDLDQIEDHLELVGDDVTHGFAKAIADAEEEAREKSRAGEVHNTRG